MAFLDGTSLRANARRTRVSRRNLEWTATSVKRLGRLDRELALLRLAETPKPCVIAG